MTRARSDEGRVSIDAVRRSPSDRASAGTIIAAFVRARLLGLRILTIDARVVHVNADAVPDLAPAAPPAKAVKRPTDAPAVHRGKQRAGLAYAVRLLEEGSRCLDEIRSTANDEETA
jgi:hypothetical protein